MCHLYHIMKHFVDWIESRYYDFCGIPIELKAKIDPRVEAKIEDNCKKLGKCIYIILVSTCVLYKIEYPCHLPTSSQ